MIIIHGSLTEKDETGPITSKTCYSCKKSDKVSIVKKTTWKTLFFVPIIPDSTYLKRCNYCQSETFISKKEFGIYQSMLNLSRNIQLESNLKHEKMLVFEERINQLYQEKQDEINAEKSRYTKLVKDMSNHELLERIKNPHGYSHAFLAVVEDEVKSRRL